MQLNFVLFSYVWGFSQWQRDILRIIRRDTQWDGAQYIQDSFGLL